MTVRTDISVDFSQSPRIITVAAPSTTLSIQDLNDTLRYIEFQDPTGLQYDSLLLSAGKNDLGGGLLVGITITLNNALLAFEGRAGPSTAQCFVSGGNLVAQDSSGNPIFSISPTTFTQVVIAQSTSAALIQANFLTLPQFIALK